MANGNSEVRVEEVIALTTSHHRPSVDLGKEATSQLLNALISLDRRTPGTKLYLLSWTGTKVPSGAVVDGHTITWTQHGMVSGAGGAYIGTYERIIECGGHEGNEQLMLVYLSPSR